MDIRKVLIGSIAVLLLASFIPDIITNFNDAETTPGADPGLSTGLGIAQIILGIATGIIVLDMVGLKITGGLTGGVRKRSRRRR